MRSQIIGLALELPELSPRKLAVRFTDERKYFVSEASVYRLPKAHDLITSPAYVVIKAANEFKDKTTAITRSRAGAGIICRPCSTTSRDTSWPGGSDPPCRHRSGRDQIGGMHDGVHQQALRIRDRDGAYGEIFMRRIRSIGIRDRPTSPRSPWQNPYAERLIGSIRRECIDHIVVFGERHLRHVLRSYMSYYNGTRTHFH